LGNNHVLDWGYAGLAEMLQTLDRVGVAYAGAGHNAAQAASPAVIDVAGKGRVVVFALGSPTSGIPPEWGATEDRPGVNVLENLSNETAQRLTERMRQIKQPGDVIVASIHWGCNWGYEVPDEQTRFARRLIEEGVDVVHGHSSHHIKALEVYRDRLILYGCGDFLTDYEGIGSYEVFRSDLALMYLAKMDPREGRLAEARLVPLRSKRFRLSYVSDEDANWLCDLVNRLGVPFGTQALLERDNSMTLRWR
jgi:poly-gamma-glutamate synthesis protein (capsule biosynthesis protein)